MTTTEIYAVYLDHCAARAKAGFSMPNSRATEDTAYELDLSIREVCEAISIQRKRTK